MLFSKDYSFRPHPAPSIRPKSPLTLPSSSRRSPKFTRPSQDISAPLSAQGQWKGLTKNFSREQERKSSVVSHASTAESFGSRISLNFESQDLSLTFSNLDLNLEFEKTFNGIKASLGENRNSSIYKHQSKESIGFPSIERRTKPVNNLRPPTPQVPKSPPLSKKFTIKRPSPLPMVSKQSLRRLRTGFSNSTSSTSTSDSVSQGSTSPKMFNLKAKSSFYFDTPRTLPFVNIPPKSGPASPLTTKMDPVKERDDIQALYSIRDSSATSSTTFSDVVELVVPKRSSESSLGAAINIMKPLRKFHAVVEDSLSDTISAFPLPPQRSPDQYELEFPSKKLEGQSTLSFLQPCQDLKDTINWQAAKVHNLSNSQSMESLLSNDVSCKSASNESDPFGSFSASTKPRTKSNDYASRMIRLQQREADFAYQMDKGAYFSTSDDDDSDSDLGEEEDFDVTEGHHLFWSSSEDDYEDDGRWQLPELSPYLGGLHRNSSVSQSSSVTSLGLATPTTPTHPDLDYFYQSTSLVLPDKRHHRRRTASSECLLLQTPEEMKITMDTAAPSEVAIAEDHLPEDCIDRELVFGKQNQSYLASTVRIISIADDTWSH